MQGPTVLDAKR